MSTISLQSAMQELPLVAILRGVTPCRVIDVATVIINAGFRFIEVPLNSPDAIESIQALSDALGEKALVGAGTVISVEQVEQVYLAGGRLIVSPNSNAEVIAYSKKKSLYSLPGFSTPSEALLAIDAGADALKLFPAESTTPEVIKALCAVLPASKAILPVGRIFANSDAMRRFIKAGAKGFGLGSGLFKADMDIDAIASNASAYVEAYHQALESC